MVVCKNTKKSAHVLKRLAGSISNNKQPILFGITCAKKKKNENK